MRRRAVLKFGATGVGAFGLTAYDAPAYAKKEEKKGEPSPVTETVDAVGTASSDADSTETALPIEEKKKAAPLSPAEERRAKLLELEEPAPVEVVAREERAEAAAA